MHKIVHICDVFEQEKWNVNNKIQTLTHTHAHTLTHAILHIFTNTRIIFENV